jgi:UDP-glucose 4-epimerase
MKNSKVLITGGMGFIGSNIAMALYQDNEVLILDDLSSGRVENVRDLVNNNGIEFIKGSITDLALLNKAFEGVDYVFHMAAVPSVMESISDPQMTNAINLTGTMNVLLACRDNNVKKVVYASSAAVYGDTDTVPINETLPINPQSPYGAQKLASEHYLRVFYQVYGLATTTLRFFNVYGPNQDPKSQYSPVIPKFISRVMQDVPPTIFGDGNQTRDFIFVKDIVKANLLAAESPVSNGMTLNIACGNETSVNDLADIIIRMMGKELKPDYAPKRDGEINRSFADISLAKDILDFTPEYSLEKGLKATIDHFTQ